MHEAARKCEGGPLVVVAAAGASSADGPTNQFSPTPADGRLVPHFVHSISIFIGSMSGHFVASPGYSYMGFGIGTEYFTVT